MSCGYKDSETGKVCGVKTSINPKTNEPYEYCVRCFRTIRKNRQEKFIEASRKAVGKRECQWIGNYIEKDKTFRIKCIELPIHDGWCSHHKKVHNEDDDGDKPRVIVKNTKNQKKVDDELDEFVTNVAKDGKRGSKKSDKSQSTKNRKDKIKLLADNPELSEEDNIIVESNKSSKKAKTPKVRETKPKPVESKKETRETKKSDDSNEPETDDFYEPNDDEIVVVKKSTKKEPRKSKSKD